MMLVQFCQIEKPTKQFLKWAGGKKQLINDFEKTLPKKVLNFKTFIEEK